MNVSGIGEEAYIHLAAVPKLCSFPWRLWPIDTAKRNHLLSIHEPENKVHKKLVSKLISIIFIPREKAGLCSLVFPPHIPGRAYARIYPRRTASISTLHQKGQMRTMSSKYAILRFQHVDYNKKVRELCLAAVSSQLAFMLEEFTGEEEQIIVVRSDKGPAALDEFVKLVEMNTFDAGEPLTKLQIANMAQRVAGIVHYYDCPGLLMQLKEALCQYPCVDGYQFVFISIV